MALKACSECGVPETITGEHLWLDNGDIVHKRARSSRMVFIETGNLDPLFSGIEQIIGAPIEHMIITAARRANGIYLKSFVPEELFEKIRKMEIDYEPLDAAFRDVGRMNGVGSYERVDRRYEQDEDDYDTVSITEPHSLPLAIAAHVGAIEALTGVDLGYRYKRESLSTYNITCYPSPHPKELKERLWFQPYEHRDGGLDLERCSTCGGPKALAKYKWHRDRGVIANKLTGRRMAIQGDALLDPVFSELEAELGDTIPRAVVKAQRRFTRGGFYTSDDLTGEEGFRQQLALRGLGNLKELNMKREGMNMKLENVALPLMVVGLAQGFFEMGFSTDSTIDWELYRGGKPRDGSEAPGLSGALGTGMERDERGMRIVVARNGPYRVSGGVPLRREIAVPGEEGHPVEWRRGEDFPLQDEYCLCRCGQSKNKPYCDGSHEQAGFDGTETCDRGRYISKCSKLAGPEFELTDARDLCSGGRFCKGRGGTWDLVKRSDDRELAELAVTQACNCPSGRLVAWKAGEPIEPQCEPSVSVTEHPGAGVSGPLWVKGGIPIESEDGTPYETRNRVALCRCGQSGNKPLCDGTHRKIGFKDQPFE